MALSVKLAMALCLMAVGTISFVVQQIGPPQAYVRSPLVATELRSQLLDGTGLRGLTVSQQAGRRAGWSRQLERPNVFDLQAEANRAAEPGRGLALSPPVELFAADVQPPALPPLAYADATALASAPESDTGSLDESGTAAALVSAAGGHDQVAVSSSQPEYKRYRVVRGDTLTKIALREWQSRDQRLVQLLAETNPAVGQRRNRLLVGEELNIPDAETARRWLAGQRVLPGAAPAVAAAATESATVAGRWYTIQKNDSLKRIAQRSLKDGRRWREILALNRSLDPNRIRPGMRIKLPPVLQLAQR